MSEHNKNLDALQDIKSMMERSSRFISLSGWSGISAGLCALVGAGFARYYIASYYAQYRHGASVPADLFRTLLTIAIAVFVAALAFAIFFTQQKAAKDGTQLWSLGTKKLLWNTCLPIAVGAVVIIRLLLSNDYYYIAAFSLIFYGLGLINGSKYTLGEVRYLGYSILGIGLCNLFLPSFSLLFWALGFGVAHIVYGVAMWFKYDREK
jgi:hypothetical protein